jgi:hypothetical protein
MRKLWAFLRALWWWLGMMGAASVGLMFAKYLADYDPLTPEHLARGDLLWIGAAMLPIAIVAERIQQRIERAERRALLGAERSVPGSLSALLAQFEPQKVLVVGTGDGEPEKFAQRLREAFVNLSPESNRWAAYSCTLDDARNVAGVCVELSADATKQETDVAVALSKWLRSEGLSDERPPRPQVAVYYAWGFLNRAHVRIAIKLTVGTK